eukprot:1332964-Amorphochlora_amoeboformis.AAC.1
MADHKEKKGKTLAEANEEKEEEKTWLEAMTECWEDTKVFCYHKGQDDQDLYCNLGCEEWVLGYDLQYLSELNGYTREGIVARRRINRNVLLFASGWLLLFFFCLYAFNTAFFSLLLHLEVDFGIGVLYG